MAGAAPGDTVLLASGTYAMDQGGVDVASGVVIRSAAGPASTILDLQYQSPGFVIQNAALPPVLEGMTIAHGRSQSLLIGGGVISINSSPVIRGCLFVANSTTDIDGNGGNGAAIGVIGGSPLIENNTIVANECGAGALSLDGTSATVRNNVFAANALPRDSTQGYAIACWNSLGLSITHNLFWANRPTDLDTGCPAYASDNTVADPQFCRPVTYPADALSGDWRVATTSLLAPGGSLSGLGAELGYCTGVAAIPATWGRIKAAYR